MGEAVERHDIGTTSPAPHLRHPLDNHIHLRPTASPAPPAEQLLRQSGADPRGLSINCTLTGRTGGTAIIHHVVNFAGSAETVGERRAKSN
jgi:hypothetical protein